MSEGKSGYCGLGPCKPKWLKGFASVPWFVCFYSATSIVTSSLTTYIVSQITTIERQFSLSSVKTGYLMACNDIGYSAFILVTSYLATRVHIPRFLSLSAALFGVSGILCSFPHFIYAPKPFNEVGGGAVTSRAQRSNQPDLCYNTSIERTISYLPVSPLNTTGVPTETTEVNDARGTVAMVFIAVGMIIQGLGKAPRAPMLAQYIDDNCNPRKTGFYMGR